MARFALSALMVAALAACGGGGGGYFGGLPAVDSTPAPAGPSLTTATGVAAVGAPISGATVELKCASGATASAATDSNGVWTVSLKSTDYPCVARVPVVEVSNVYASLYSMAPPITTTTWLHSVVAAAGTTNITPLTDLIVGILSGQDPATWYANAANGTLSGAITPAALASAKDKLATTLATLPGKPPLPDGFDPLSSPFSAQAGDPADDLLESYGIALKAAGLTQAEAAGRAAGDEGLTQVSYAATGFTTPNLASFRVAAAKTLAGSYAMALPDSLRGTSWATASLDVNGNLSALITGPFSAVVSKDANRVAELCTYNEGVQRSQYVVVAEDLVPVSDLTELQDRSFIEYENCAATGNARFQVDGSFVFTAYGEPSDPAVANIAQAFTTAGIEKQQTGGTAVLRAKAFKYTANGITKYVYILVSTRRDATTPALNGDTDYVLMGISQLPS